MIESKLYQAAQALPTPKTSFCEIENKARISKNNQTFRLRRYRMVAAMLVCAFLLMGSAVVAATTEVNYSAWAKHSGQFSDAEVAAEKVGVTLPEAINDSPFYNITTMYVAPEGTTYLDALKNPAYPWYSVNYGIQNVVREYYSDKPDSGYSESIDIDDKYSLSFGSTDNKLFRYVFGLNENGDRILENAIQGSYQTVEHNGLTMQIVSDVQYDAENSNEVFAYHHRIIWIDEENHAVFCLNKAFYADENAADQMPKEMIDLAKEIIDMN